MDWRLELVTPASVLPVTLDEVKDHALVQHDEDDAWWDARIHEATAKAREWSSKAMVTETWKLRLAQWPRSGRIYLPRPPLQSVTSITYVDADGASQTLATSVYDVDTTPEPGLVAPKYGQSWPSLRLQEGVPAVTVTYVAGHLSRGDDRLATPRRVILALTALWGRYRDGTVEEEKPVVEAEREVLAELNSFRCYHDFGPDCG